MQTSRVYRSILRTIGFGLDKAAWQPQNVDALGDTLCENEHRLSKYSTDLGHVTVDPFRIILKQDATPVKQNPYRHSPVLAVKVRTEIYKLLLPGVPRRSYSNWVSPLVVVAKSDGRMRLTCSYKNFIYECSCNNSNLSSFRGLRSSLKTRELKIVQHDILDQCIPPMHHR